MRLFNKFLVQRRDGTVPHWPWFVLGGADPAAPQALRAYADAARRMGMDEEYCDQVLLVADRFEQWRRDNWTGDPDAAPHRDDDPTIVSRISPYATELPPKGLRRWPGDKS